VDAMSAELARRGVELLSGMPYWPGEHRCGRQAAAVRKETTP
jgi:hypothetical protein